MQKEGKMINIDEFIQAHKLSCQSRHKESGQFAKYPCTCGRDEAVKQLSSLRAESEARRVTLEQKAEEVRHEWTRAENAETALETALDLNAKGAKAIEGYRVALEEAKAVIRGTLMGVDTGAEEWLQKYGDK